MTYFYNNSVLGGTFDHLHKGHKLFIDQAFKISKKVTIGVTQDSLTKDKVLPDVIQDFRTRQNQLIEYLKEQGYEKRAKVISIEDFYGNTLSDENLDAIFTDIKNVEKIGIINEKRKRLGFSEIKHVNVPLLLDDRGIEISSTRIRRGKINGDGKVFLDFFDKTLILPKSLRQRLREPFGKVVKNFDKKDLISATVLVAVGDVVVSDLRAINLMPDICIYDLHTKKKKISDEKILANLPKTVTESINKPGKINRDVVQEIENALDGVLESDDQTAIKIKGEEDLLALPAIILAPLESIVVYGLRDKGAVIVRVTEEIKEKIITSYLSHFTS